MKSNIYRNMSRVFNPIKTCYVLLALIVFSLPLTAYSQNRDYASHPEIPFQYKNLDLKLNLEMNQNLIKGEADYTLAPYLSHSKKVLMKAYRTDIRSVTVDGKQVDYDLRNDSLEINLPKAYPAGTNFKIKIIYEAQPRFGWHANSDGTYWTSLLPKTVAHIFPVFDHPRITVKTQLHLIIPSGMDAVANGKLMGEKMIKSGWKEVSWQTVKPIPVTNISFSVGKFHHSETMFGVKTLRIYNQKGLLSEQERQKLLQTAYKTLQQVQNYLGVEYPYSELNIVVLPDNHWEKRNYAASYCYLFTNSGDLTNQLQKAIYAQWFGVFQRSEQYGAAQPQLMFQAWLQWNLQHKIQKGWNNEDSPEAPQTLYDVYNDKQWKRWQSYFKVTDDSDFSETLKETTPYLIAHQGGVMNWDDYARYWYKKTGQWFMIPQLPEIKKQQKTTYQLSYDYNETKRSVRIIVKPEIGKSKELITLPFVKTENQGLVRGNLTFSGMGDTLNEQVKSGLLNVAVQVPDTIPVKIEEKKPLSFWFYQLRKGSTVAEREQAAQALGTFKGDPDLQLALVDVLHKDPSPDVKVAVIRSLAEITSGATGTDQLFLKQLDSNNENVKKAVIQALANYPGDDSATMAVRGIIHRSDVSPELKKAAIMTMQKINNGSEFRSFAKQFMSGDTTHTYTMTVLNALIENGDTTYVDTLANKFLKAGYPYELRKKSLNFVKKFDHNAQNWYKRLGTLIQDNDPRIRYIGWSLYKRLKKPQVVKLIKEQLPEEEDLRVHDEILTIRQEISSNKGHN
ncbi:MAG TPA: hypothetical protein VJ991_13915 [Balneolales bacterium]|nr:hypothetical protein [Balneolales bacterium]